MVWNEFLVISGFAYDVCFIKSTNTESDEYDILVLGRISNRKIDTDIK